MPRAKVTLKLAFILVVVSVAFFGFPFARVQACTQETNQIAPEQTILGSLQRALNAPVAHADAPCWLLAMQKSKTITLELVAGNGGYVWGGDNGTIHVTLRKIDYLEVKNSSGTTAEPYLSGVKLFSNTITTFTIPKDEIMTLKCIRLGDAIFMDSEGGSIGITCE